MGPMVAQLALALLSAAVFSFSGPENLSQSNGGAVNGEIRIGGKAYHLITAELGQRDNAEAKNWVSATQYCRNKFGKTGRLTNIDDRVTFLVLQAALGKRWPGVELRCWVDGLYDPSEGQFIWRERRTPVDQPWTPWGKGEPQKPFTARRRIVYHQVTDTRAEFYTDDTDSLHGYLCQHTPEA